MYKIRPKVSVKGPLLIHDNMDELLELREENTKYKKLYEDLTKR